MSQQIQTCCKVDSVEAVHWNRGNVTMYLCRKHYTRSQKIGLPENKSLDILCADVSNDVTYNHSVSRNKMEHCVGEDCEAAHTTPRWRDTVSEGPPKSV
jgi:hypothetical protein